VRPDIINRIKEGSIKAHYNSAIKEIKEKEIIVETPEGEIELENDFVLALTGYMPNFEFLKNLGIQLSKDDKQLPNYNPETMESNIEGLYLAGVICGGMETHKWFIENSRIHAPMIVKNIVSSNSK
jgi:thioredoxin reductase (NADPH)